MGTQNDAPLRPAGTTSAHDRHRLRPRTLTDVDTIDTRTARSATAVRS